MYISEIMTIATIAIILLGFILWVDPSSKLFLDSDDLKGENSTSDSQEKKSPAIEKRKKAGFYFIMIGCVLGIVFTLTGKFINCQ